MQITVAGPQIAEDAVGSYFSRDEVGPMGQVATNEGVQVSGAGMQRESLVKRNVLLFLSYLGALFLVAGAYF